MTCIYSLPCLGISSKLIGPLPWINCALFNPQGENNASDPNETKWLASTRDLKGTLKVGFIIIISIVCIYLCNGCGAVQTCFTELCLRKEILTTDNDTKVKF